MKRGKCSESCRNAATASISFASIHGSGRSLPVPSVVDPWKTWSGRTRASSIYPGPISGTFQELRIQKGAEVSTGSAPTYLPLQVLPQLCPLNWKQADDHLEPAIVVHIIEEPMMCRRGDSFLPKKRFVFCGFMFYKVVPPVLAATSIYCYGPRPGCRGETQCVRVSLEYLSEEPTLSYA